MPLPRCNFASTASLVLQIVWMVINHARTLGIHFGNNRIQTEFLQVIRKIRGEPCGYRLRGKRRDLGRNPEHFPIGCHFGGHRRANFTPLSQCLVVSSAAPPAAPSPRASTPSSFLALTPPAPPVSVLALPAPLPPRCPLHGDVLYPPPSPSMVTSQQ